MGFTLQINSPFKPPAGPWSPKGHIQPHRSHLPRRRNPKPCFQNFHATAEAAAQKPKPMPTPVLTPKVERVSAPAPTSTSISMPITPIPTPCPPKADEPHLQEIIPALWVAFSDSTAPLSGTASNSAHEIQTGFTHIVEIAHSAGEVWRDFPETSFPLLLEHRSASVGSCGLGRMRLGGFGFGWVDD